MFIVGIVSIGLILAVIGTAIFRLLVDRRYTAIQREPDHPILFRRKLNYLRKIEQARDIRYLFAASLITGAAAILLIGSFLFLSEDQQTLKQQNTALKGRILQLEKRQTQLAQSIPLKKYPKEGLGLGDYEWNKLMAKGEEEHVQEQVEEDLSQRLAHYLGTSNTALSVTAPHTVSLHLEGHTEEKANQEVIKSNIDAFVKEAEAISEWTQIQVRMVTSVGMKETHVYNVTYERKNGDESFNKQNVSEENLKNDGEKG